MSMATFEMAAVSDRTSNDSYPSSERIRRET